MPSAGLSRCRPQAARSLTGPLQVCIMDQMPVSALPPVDKGWNSDAFRGKVEDRDVAPDTPSHVNRRGKS